MNTTKQNNQEVTPLQKLPKDFPPLSKDKLILIETRISEGWQIIHGNNVRLPLYEKWSGHDVERLVRSVWKDKTRIIWAVKPKGTL